MTTKEIAERLVEINRSGDYKQAYAELYAPDVVSIENQNDAPQAFVGLDAIKEKAEHWEGNVEEIHEMKCSDPLVADSSFAVTFFIDATFKDMGRQSLTELGVYEVKDGKVVREEFHS